MNNSVFWALALGSCIACAEQGPSEATPGWLDQRADISDARYAKRIFVLNAAPYVDRKSPRDSCTSLRLLHNGHWKFDASGLPWKQHRRDASHGGDWQFFDKGNWANADGYRAFNIVRRGLSNVLEKQPDLVNALVPLHILYSFYVNSDVGPQLSLGGVLGDAQGFLCVDRLLGGGSLRLSPELKRDPPQGGSEHKQQGREDRKRKSPPSHKPFYQRLFVMLVLLVPSLGFALGAGQALYKNRVGLSAALFGLSALCGLGGLAVLLLNVWST